MMIYKLSPVLPPTRLIQGRLAVEVSLKGSLGTGKKMLIDEWEWPRVKLALGDLWGLKEAKAGFRYVVSLGAQRGLVLARWIMRAGAGQVVSYRNGERLDVRRSNLAVVDRQEFVAGVFGHREA